MSSMEMYDNPLISRYASPEMSRLWGAQNRHATWRRLWIFLAESQQELGLAISDAQLQEMRAHIEDIDFAAVARYERQFRHDVMAHVHAYGDLCPQARPIIHWGATSCYVTDNTDLILMRRALEMVRDRLVAVIDRLGSFATEQRDLPCLGLTHLQPAQPTTVGKRACLWAYDLALDMDEVLHRLDQLRCRGVQGTTGTQASFLEMFQGDHQRVEQLQQTIARKMGFSEPYKVTGQTYSRKVDVQIIDVLSGIGQSAHKAATDLRLLASRQELEEPFEQHQIGSSAMAYKRNPMRSERICSLARFAMSLQSSAGNTFATQWMERTLDDSANRRLVIPQAFLAIDAVLRLYQNVVTGLVVYPGVISRNLREHLPFMATENILMAGVAAGGDRQELHEAIRQHSQAAAHVMKVEGLPNDLLERLRRDPRFANVPLDATLDPRGLIGRAPEQVDRFVADVVQPLRAQFPDALKSHVEINV